MKFSTLSNNQQEILEIITSHIRLNGVSPSLRDVMKASKNINSLRGVVIQLNALESAGYITRSSEAKSIEVNESLWSNNNELIEIPLFAGSVQAGLPSLFDDYYDSKVFVMLSATKGLRHVYAMKIRGDSMIDADIEDGDFAIITEYVNPNDGDIVVALTEDGITLKTFRIIEGHPILFPANKNYKPISDRFEVRGKLINVLKPEMIQYYQKLKSFSSSF